MSKMRDEIITYIQAGFPLIAVNTIELTRAIGEIGNLISEWNKNLAKTNANEYLKTHGYAVSVWSANNGWTVGNQVIKGTDDPRRAIEYVLGKDTNPGIYILQNFHMWWSDQLLAPYIVQNIIDVAREKPPHKHLFFVGSMGNLPASISSLFSWVDFELPTRQELAENTKKWDKLLSTKLTDHDRLSIADAAAGMTAYEADCAVKASIVHEKGKRVNVESIFREKAKSVRKTGILEYMEVSETIAEVGGLTAMKHYLEKISEVFLNREDAEKYHLPVPRGVLIAGVTGTGKSLTAKVIANMFGVPLYYWDLGKLFGGVVGETERNTREAFKLIDSVSPAVFMIEEIEKALAGFESSGQTDSGVTARVVGSFLTYMQERKSPSFFVATANSVDKLLPEQLRRFNSIWFVDLPNDKERKEIIHIHIAKTGRSPKKYDVDKIVEKTALFTGAEIQGVVEDAMLTAFKDNRREYTTKDILNAVADCPLIAKTKEREIASLRKWAKGRARIANVEGKNIPAWWDEVDHLIIDKEEQGVGV